MNYTDIFNKRGYLYNQAHKLCPGARNIERELLLNLLKLAPQDIVIDAPAGGGFVVEALQSKVSQTICIEPSHEFASEIPSNLQVFNTPINKIPLPACFATKYISLAGLHHLSREDVRTTFSEANRLLQPDGIIAVADVQDNTAPAKFLNGPVDQYSHTGHRGNFFKSGELKQLLIDSGFRNVHEQYHQFDWVFESRSQMITFVTLLFGMSKASANEVESLIDQHLNVNLDEDKATLTWGLAYASGTR